MATEPSAADMVAAIVRTYRDATPAQVAAGRRWYPAAGRIVDGIAEYTGAGRGTTAAVVAALSPRNPWSWNVADAAAFMLAAAEGRTVRPTATTFNVNADRAWSIATGGTDWTTAAPKVRSFVANILGDQDAVTVDVWAIRVATSGAIHEVRNDGQYRRVADAYRAAAAVVGGDAPRSVQAITWLVAESTGLGSHRRGRHGQTLKRSALPWVAGLLAL